MRGLKPLRADAVSPKGDGIVLLGSRCLACGQVLFPRHAFCPACDSGPVEPLEFAGTATLVSWTRVYMPTMRMKAPYDAGYVRLTEGPLIYAPIKLNSTRAYCVDMPMRAALLALGEGNDQVCAYQFFSDTEAPDA